MNKVRTLIIGIVSLLSMVFAKDPTTIISSDRMEMLKFYDHNEFMFEGNVQIKNVNFTGSGGRMWVYSVTHEHHTEEIVPALFYLIKWEVKAFPQICFLNFNLKRPNESAADSVSQLGQIKLIIAWDNVHLETEDKETGERKRSISGKAVVYPISMKMVLTENPSVYSSTQGAFRGGKITFYKNSGQIIVEEPEPGKRSQVFLEE